MRTRDEHTSGWALDLREPEVLSAWRAAAGRLKAYCQPGGLASWLLSGGDAAPKPVAMAGTVAHQTRARLPLLVSSTREIDIFGALNAALPLVATSQGPMSSWRDFLTGYACGLKSSPALDIRRVRFLCEFDNAVTVTASHSHVARLSGVEPPPPGDGCLWTCTVLEAISYGSTTLASLLAQRAMSAGRASGADAMLGALLGSALWRGCPYESDLIGHLCGSEPNSPSCATHWPD